MEDINITTFEMARTRTMEKLYLTGALMKRPEYVVPEFKGYQNKFFDNIYEYIINCVEDDNPNVQSIKRIIWSLSADNVEATKDAVISLLEDIDLDISYAIQAYRKAVLTDDYFEVVPSTRRTGGLYSKAVRYINRRFDSLSNPDCPLDLTLATLASVQRIVNSYMKLIDIAEKNDDIQNRQATLYDNRINSINLFDPRFDTIDYGMGYAPYNKLFKKNMQSFIKDESEDKCTYYTFPSDETLDNLSRSLLDK